MCVRDRAVLIPGHHAVWGNTEAVEQIDSEKLGALSKCQSLDDWSLNLLGMLWEAEVKR